MCAAADRIERETARMNLTQMASASVKIISDTVSGWRQAGHPMREFEIMRPTTAPVAWNTPSIKGRNAGFRPDWSVASKPQLQGACRAVLDRADRDRGESRDSSPPTPPDVRVRIRRFGGLSRPRHRDGSQAKGPQGASG